jgi:hypothetical protein
MKCSFFAALLRGIRGLHMHQGTGRVDASARQSRDMDAASSSNQYLTSEVLTSEVMHRYLLTMNSYEDAA